MDKKTIRYRYLVGLLFVLVFCRVVSANVVPDPSFEGGLQYWKMPDNTASIVTSPTRTGSKAIKMINTGNGSNSKSHTAGQTNIRGIVPGREYTYRVYVSGKGLKGIGDGGKPLAVVRWRDSAGKIIPTGEGKWKESYLWAPYGSYGFKPLVMNLQAPSNAKFFDVMFRTWWGTTGGSSIWDDVSLTPRDFSKRGKLVATYQAESANVKSGGSVHKLHTDYTGAGYYDIKSNGAVLEWSNVAGGGKRVLSFRYSWEGNVRNLELFINGVSQGARRPLPTGRRGVWASDLWNVNLPSGNNKVRLVISKKGGLNSQPMIDKFDVYNPGSSGELIPPLALINQAPTITTIDSQTVTEGELLVVPVVAQDADGPSPIKLSQTNSLPGKPNIISDSGDGIGELYWSSSVGDAANSPYYVTVEAKDGAGAARSQRVRVDVASQNGCCVADGDGRLSGNLAPAPSRVNLTSVGISDWVHWGLKRASDLNRKRTDQSQISDFTPINNAAAPRGTNRLTVYSWSNGMDTPTVSNTKSGVRVYHIGKGFEFTVPAGTVQQSLKIYVGAKNAGGRLKANLSDGSAPAYVTQVERLNGTGTISRVITLQFQAASAGGELTVRYVLESKPGRTGWISLESAVLQ